MKKLIYILGIIIVAFSVTGCALKGDREFYIYDEARILSDADKDAMADIFEGKVYNDVYLFTVPKKMTYAEAMDYKSPNDDVSWLQRNNVFRVYYFPQMKWVRVSVSANRKNDYDRKYAIPLYHTQHHAQNAKDPANEVLMPILRDISTLTSQPVSWLAPASSILSVVEWLNEEFILPTNNLLHVLFFRFPLYLSLLWVRVFHGTGWPIFFLILALIALSFARSFTDKHVWIYSMLYVLHLLVLVCLVFLVVPSYDTMSLVREMGMNDVAGILDANFMKAEASEHTWLGSILFILLYLAHRVLGYYLVKAPLTDKSNEQQMEEKTNTFADKSTQVLLMFILSFMMPKSIVWAVCAYLLQQIICSDLLRQSKPEGAPIGSMLELQLLITLPIVYFIILLDWYVVHLSWIDTTYLWFTRVLLFIARGSDPGVYVTLGLMLASIIGVCWLLWYMGKRFWTEYLQDFIKAFLILSSDGSEEHKEAMGISMMKSLGWSLATWLATLLFLGTFAAIDACFEDTPASSKLNAEHERCIATFDKYYNDANADNLDALRGAVVYLDSIGYYENDNRYKGSKVYLQKREELRTRTNVIYQTIDGKYQRARRGSAAKKQLYEKRKAVQSLSEKLYPERESASPPAKNSTK